MSHRQTPKIDPRKEVMTYKEEGEGIARTVQVHGGVVVKAESWLVLTIVAVPLEVGGGLRQNLKSCERRLM